MQAHFVGESEYDVADSIPASYGTQPPSTNDSNRPTSVPPVVDPVPHNVDPGPTVVIPKPEPEIAPPDPPIPPEEPESGPKDLLLIVGLAVAAAVVAVAAKLTKSKSGKVNPEVVDEVITRGGIEK